ncbi:MAG: hypothetical protein ACK5MN_03245 [Lachnospiraceae bacterium]
MDSLSKEQYKLLLSLSLTDSIEYESLGENEKEVVDFLTDSKKYVTYDIKRHVNLDKPSFGYYERYEKVRITELGKSHLATRRAYSRRFIIPLIVSIVAVILAALSIVLSPYFSAFFTSLYGL